MKVSIIIPTYNEETTIQSLVSYLLAHGDLSSTEVIVSDGGSLDGTMELAQAAGATVVKSPSRGRAAQMNYGAELSSGDVLYFVHADSLPPTTFYADVMEQVEGGYHMGCYRFRFDSSNWLLRINSFFTRFDRLVFRGGDQTLFVRKEVFEALGGYRQDFLIMEEYDFIARARLTYRFRIIPKEVVVSARKYEKHSYLRVNLANLIVFSMYRWGYSQHELVTTYHKWLRLRNYDHLSASPLK